MGFWIYDVLHEPGIHADRPAAGDVTKGSLYPCTTHNLIYQSDGDATWTTWVATSPTTGVAAEIMLAVSDETTAITSGPGKLTFRMPFAMTLTAVRASLTSASSGSGPVTVDINEAGVSILSTKLTIDDSERTSTTAATPAVISDANLADDAEITIDIDDEGAAAKGLKVYLIGLRA